MVIQEISIKEINLGDERFRISEDLDSAPVLESLREIGQLNPVLVLDEDAGKIIVCGFRRIRAMRKLGIPRVFVRILPGQSPDPVRAYRMALWDNLAGRQLNPLEKARFLYNLRKNFSVADDTLAKVYLPLLGLNPAENVLESYLLLHAIQPALRKCFLDCRLTLASVEAVSEMPATVQNRIASLMEKIRLSASLQRKFLGLLQDLAAVSGDELDVPVRSPEVLEIIEDSRLSPFQRGEKVYQFLYNLRNPKLSQALAQFLAKRRSLRLPGSIRISAHPFFEEPGVRVEFEAPDVERFRDLASALEEAARQPELRELFCVK